MRSGGAEAQGRREPKERTKAKIPGAIRQAVYERDAYRCVACGSWKSLSIDHIYPESLGGSTTLDNLQTMCLACNCSKGARVEAGQSD